MKEKIYNYIIQELGFDDCGVANPFLDTELDGHVEWLKNGFHGDMTYLEDHLKFKENPELLLENVQSAIVVVKNYKNTEQSQLNNEFKIARYAVGEDYHTVIGDKLNSLADFIKREDPSAQCYIAVDSRPVAERKLAVRSGIGFLGKHGLVIKPGLGSYFFIGVILTTLKLPEDEPLRWDCGECRLCLDACPTGALLENFTMDARKCISYQTIEKKTPMTEEERTESRGWKFGCDICQEVCPYNHDRIPLTNWTEFMPESGVGFKFFETQSEPAELNIPKNSAMYRSRKRVISNIKALKDSHETHSK